MIFSSSENEWHNVYSLAHTHTKPLNEQPVTPNVPDSSRKWMNRLSHISGLNAKPMTILPYWFKKMALILIPAFILGHLKQYFL